VRYGQLVAMAVCAAGDVLVSVGEPEWLSTVELQPLVASQRATRY